MIRAESVAKSSSELQIKRSMHRIQQQSLIRVRPERPDQRLNGLSIAAFTSTSSGAPGTTGAGQVVPSSAVTGLPLRSTPEPPPAAPSARREVAILDMDAAVQPGATGLGGGIQTVPHCRVIGSPS